MSNANVLIIDDEEQLRLILGKYLQTQGYDTTTVESGEEALEILEREEFDCSVCDVNLPGLAGEEILEHIQRSFPTMPVIMLTGCVEVDLAVNLMKVGAFDFLTKPVRLEQFSTCLERALRHRELLRENRRLELENRSYQRQLEKKVIEQTFQISTQGEFVNRLNSLQSLGSAIELVERFIKELLGCRRVNLLIKKEEGYNLQELCASTDGEIREFEINHDTELLFKRIAQDRIVSLESTGADPAAAHFLKTLDPVRTNGVTTVAALNLDGLPYGILVIQADEDQARTGDRDIQILRFVADSASIAIHNQLNRMKIEKGYLDTVKALALAVEAKDPYTRGHSDRVRIYAEMMGRKLNLPESEIKMLTFAGILHDIGKIGIPISLIHKAGRLSDQEYREVQKHPVIGENMIGHIAFLKKARKMIRHHHERWDGKGYPDYLKGEEVCLGARVLAVADTFDAMTTDRPYRKAFSPATALEELVRCANKQFDRNCVKAFLEIPTSSFFKASGDAQISQASSPPG